MQRCDHVNTLYFVVGWVDGIKAIFDLNLYIILDGCLLIWTFGLMIFGCLLKKILLKKKTF